MAWNEEREAQFRSYYAEGLPHSDIAAKLGITRNASIGKAHRLGLEARACRPKLRKPWEIQGISERTWYRDRQKAEGRHSKSLVRERLASEARHGGNAVTEIVTAVGDGPLTIIELQPHSCRWPVGGEGAEMLYCGAAKACGPYCARHYRMAYATPARVRAAYHWTGGAA